MTDEPSLSRTAPPPPTEADYEAIAAAVMGTVRGRWFLAEFAKRNRNADSALILERIDRIEKLLHAPPPAVSPAERVRIDLVEMAKAIARTRCEIAAIKPDGDAKGTLSEASEELGSIVQTTERATSDILASAERIQEIAWTLRERGADSAICDALDQRATDVYSACSFQDLTGQRTRKVVDVLQFLEHRIRAMIEIWGGAVPDEDGAPAATAAPHVGEDRTVPHLEQQDIDRMMPSARPDAPPVGAKQNGHDVAAAAHASAADDWAHPVAANHRLVAGIAASAAPGPAGGTAAATAIATTVPAEAMRAAETMMTPAMAVVGATALALDPAPIAPARLPEFAPEPEAEPPAEAELRAEPKPEPQAEAEFQAEAAAQAKAERQAEAEVQAEAQVELQAEPEPEPQSELTAEFSPLAETAPPPAQPEPPAEPPEIEADAATTELRTDPAAVLKRILAIIRAPSEPVTWPPAAQDGSPSVAAAQPTEPVAAPEATAAATVAAVSILAPAVAEIVAAESSGPDVLVVGIAAAEQTPAAGGAAQPDEPAEARAPKGVINDAILMPMSGPLTVDQAVDAMLKAPGRVDVAATHASAGVPAPVEESTAGEPPAVTAEPIAHETEPLAAGMSQPSFVIDAPEFTMIARAPVTELAPEPAPVAEAVAAAIAEPAAPEPQAVPVELDAPMAAEAAARPDEPPAEPVAAAPAPPVTSVPPPVAAAEPTPPVVPPAALPAEPARAARHPALAAITALSDEEKIALFS